MSNHRQVLPKSHWYEVNKFIENEKTVWWIAVYFLNELISCWQKSKASNNFQMTASAQLIIIILIKIILTTWDEFTCAT